jgi:hypothetical protein
MDLVEPVGYDTLWQKFENEVYQTVKQGLEGLFRVEWNSEVYGLKPDAVAYLECKCMAEEEKTCSFPVFLFEAFCKFKVEKDYYSKKDEQMSKYAEICDAVLVMPQGYEGRPYCKSRNGYHIVSFHHLRALLESIKSEAIIEKRDEMCGPVPSCSSKNVYKHFELAIRSKVDRCPECNSKVFPISLIYCSQYDEYYHPDFLDFESVHEYTPPIATHAECSGCSNSSFGWDYDDCPNTNIEHKYQCSNYEKCGAIFDPETKKIVRNFEEGHIMNLSDSCKYYEKVR